MNDFKPEYCLDTQYAEHAAQIDEARDAARLEDHFHLIEFDELTEESEREALFATIQLADILECWTLDGHDMVERSVHLALRTATALSQSDEIKLEFSELVSRFESEFTRQQLFAEARQYLDDNIHIYHFVRANLDDIDRSGQYRPEAEAICGIIFKWADQAIEVSYLNDNFTAS